MARRCKCRLCGESLTTDIAYRIKIKDKNVYFCNSEEAELYKKRIDDKKSLEKYLKKEVLNYDDKQKLPNMLCKKVKELSDSYGNEIVLETFKQQIKTIKYYSKNKSFKNEGYKILYIMAIINNHINNVYNDYKLMKRQQKIKENFDIDVDMFNKVKNVNGKNTGKNISSFLEDGDF